MRIILAFVGKQSWTWDRECRSWAFAWGIKASFTPSAAELSAPRQVVHGKTSYVFHNGDPLFAGVPRAFEAMRYHSLVAEPASMPDSLQVTAKTWDDCVMAVRHRDFPIYGIQFHPESILTPIGKQLLRNFLQPDCVEDATAASDALSATAPVVPTMNENCVAQMTSLLDRALRAEFIC